MGGPETGDTPNANACVQDMTYTTTIKNYDSYTSMPQGLDFRALGAPGQDDDAARAHFVQLVTSDGNCAFRPFPWKWAQHNTYRGVPETGGPERDQEGTARRVPDPWPDPGREQPAVHLASFSGRSDGAPVLSLHPAARLHRRRGSMRFWRLLSGCGRHVWRSGELRRAGARLRGGQRHRYTELLSGAAWLLPRERRLHAMPRQAKQLSIGDVATKALV